MIQNLQTMTTLNNGVEMPAFGLGVFRTKPGDEVYNAVRWALDYGYRLIDTATLYLNEKDVGRAVKDSNVPRDEVFITTKIWLDDFDDPEKALDKSLKELDSEYVDLYLQHWPGTDADRRHRTWETMLELSQKGKIRACGVSNYQLAQLEQLVESTGAIPTNNQVELHPWHQQRDLREYAKQKEISITAWGPLFHGYISRAEHIDELGEKYNKSAAQIVLRWHIEQGDINLIPKSSNQKRILENSEVFDFELSEEDIRLLNEMDGRVSLAYDAILFNGDADVARAERDARIKRAGIL